MLVETLDLSNYEEKVSKNYHRLAKTHLRILASQVPQSFIDRFEDEETALTELLDAVYGTMEVEDHDE
jgi:hypothetical protein